MAREFARKFYSSAAWQSCRNNYSAMRRHLCEDCMKRGVIKQGVEVHHIEELTPLNIHRPEVTLNYDNLILLCRECHKARHESKERRYIIGSNGEIICNNTESTPPCSVKHRETQ